MSLHKVRMGQVGSVRLEVVARWDLQGFGSPVLSKESVPDLLTVAFSRERLYGSGYAVGVSRFGIYLFPQLGYAGCNQVVNCLFAEFPLMPVRDPLAHTSSSYWESSSICT